MVSCIIPVFNGRQYLAECLDSIFAQAHRPLEAIVVDDGSTDGSGNAARAYPQPVRVLTQPNAGAPAARNAGIAAANGPLIAFLDADDLWTSDRLRVQMARMAARPELGFVAGLARNFWIEELGDEARRLADSARAGVVPAYVTGTMLVRREAFDRVGLFDASLRHGDSTEWILRAREAGVAEELVNKVCLLRRIHRTNLSRVQRAASRDEFLAIIKRNLDRRRGGGETEKR
ncbi:MAG: putative glycosyltransferase EpsJ [Phycisphaerae bacterium]|nr:putative glycosyltransferase EpsJ [Phycisphaerae bacterium]